jgi:NADH-quinone oxidoreductase subunit N
MDYSLLESFGYFWPELILIGGLIGAMLLDLVARPGIHPWMRGPIHAGWPARVALLAAFGAWFATLVQFDWAPGWLFNRNLVFDQFAVFFRAVIGLATIAAVWMSMGSREVRGASVGEYYVLLLASAVGMFLMAAAANLLMAYLSLEFLSLTSYALTGLRRRDRRAGEAALKYLIYGGVASGAMIYGMSWIYGLTGSMERSRRFRSTCGPPMCTPVHRFPLPPFLRRARRLPASAC